MARKFKTIEILMTTLQETFGHGPFSSERGRVPHSTIIHCNTCGETIEYNNLAQDTIPAILTECKGN